LNKIYDSEGQIGRTNFGRRWDKTEDRIVKFSLRIKRFLGSGSVGLFGLAAILTFLLAACSAAPAATEAPPAPTPTVQERAEPTTPPPATEAPTATLPAQHVILYAPPEASAEQSAELQTILSELAAGAGLLFELRPQLAPADLSPATRLVVALPPAPGLAELAAAAPETQFLAVAFPGLTTTPNLSLVGPQGARLDQQGFLAGYLAAVITPDWRAGVLATGEGEADQEARQGFLNGLTYFCGLCRPTYPPYQQYPLAADLAGGVQAALQSLAGGAVETIYLTPGVDAASLATELCQSGAMLIGSGPPPIGLENRWVASVQTDTGAAVRALWPQLLNGQGGQVVEMPVTVRAYDENILTPGRLAMVERFIQEDLLPGYVSTGVEAPAGLPATSAP
ncbi:MAG TPA: hypothetical protein VLS48_04750, partial [Anaerolineales bacterium]|nr:hypothetical protein [Anaerolineales bacterium]